MVADSRKTKAQLIAELQDLRSQLNADRPKSKRSRRVAEDSRLLQLLHDAFPFPAMLIRRDKTVVMANKVAEEMGATEGGICWRDFARSSCTASNSERNTECEGCLAESAFELGHPQRDPEVRAHGRVWDVHWIPVGKNEFLHFAIDITDRKNVEDNLEEARGWLEAVVEGSRDAIFISDEDSKFTAVNRAAVEITGYSRNQLLEMRIPDLHEGIDLHAYEQYHDSIMAGEEVTSEAPILRADRQKVDTEFSNRRIDIGGVSFMHTTARDITDRKQAAEALRIQRDVAIELGAAPDLERACEGLLDNALQLEGVDCGGVYVLDRSTNSLDLIAHRGLSAEFLDSVHHYDAESHQAKLVAEGTPVYQLFEEAIVSQDGAIVDEGLRALAVIPVRAPDEGGGSDVVAALNLASHERNEIPEMTRLVLEGIAAQVGEVIARVQSEAARHESEQRFRALLDQASDAILIVDPSLANGPVIVDANKAAWEQHGYKKDEFLGKSMDSLDERDATGWGRNRAERLLSGEPVHFEGTHVRKDGTTFPVEIAARQIRIGDKNLILSVGRDISARKRVEEALRKARDELEIRVAERTEELTRLNEELKREVAERRQAVDEMLASEERFHTFMDHFPGVAFINEPGHSVVYANPQFCTLHDLDSEQFKEIKYTTLYSPERAAEIVDQDKAVLAAQGPVLSDVVRPSTDGEIHWLLHKFPIYRKGRPPLIGGMAIDVTERRKAEDEVRRFRRIADAANYAMAIVGLDGEILYVNRTAAEIHGFTVAEVVGNNLEMFHSDHQMPAVSAVIEQAQRNGQFGPTEVWHQRKDGTTFPMLMSGVLLKDEAGCPTHMAATAIDITDRKDAEAALARSEERFRAFFEQAPEYCYIVLPDGTVSDVNTSALRALGCSKEEIVGQPLLEAIYSEGCRDVAASAFEEWKETGEVRDMELTIKTKEGEEREVLLSAQAVYDEAGKVLHSISVQHDITERRQAEEKLRRAERLASVGTLASGVAHEINNPIAGIRAAAEFAEQTGSQSDKEAIVDGALKDIQSEADRCAKIIRGLLDFARQEPVEKAAHDINQVVRSAIDLTTSFVKSGNGEVVFAPGEALPMVELNSMEMEHAVANLIRNAVESGSNIRVELSTFESDDGVTITVEDNGCGVSRRSINRIFDLFHTTRRSEGGTGLGLSLVHSIVSDHGGTVGVTSEEGVGSKFTVVLPAASEESGSNDT